jgi:hypothetical protein
VLHRLAERELVRFQRGAYRHCRIARRLAALNCSHLAAKAVVAIDGHETHCSEKVRCPDCHVRSEEVKRGGKLIKVEQYYHRLVVAQRVGAHPAVVLDAEVIKPGEGELTAGYRLVARLGAVYGPKLVGVVVADALYDCEPFRSVCREEGFRSVVRHNREDRPPGSELKRALDRRDPQRRKRDGWHHDPVSGRKYDYWVEQEPFNGRRYVEVTRTNPDGTVQTGGVVTDLPGHIPAMVAAIVMETRWEQENTGFHELAGQLSFDRALVHKDRPTGAWAVVLLALVAFNAWQMYLYRDLGLDPRRPKRTWNDLRRDLFESLHTLTRPPTPTTRARPP